MLAPDSLVWLKAAATGPANKRYAAIDHLGGSHEAAAQVVPQLQKLLRDQDPQVRWRSARALGDYGAQAAAAASDLRTLLKDKDAIVQYHAAIALGKVGDRSEETTQALVDVATSQDPRVARAAVSAIRSLKPGPKVVCDALCQALKSNDQAVTLHALEAVVEQGANAVPMLQEALGRPETAYLACTAIEQIGPDAAGTVPELVALLGKTKHSQLLIQALLALASIGPAADAAAPQVLTLLDTPNDATVPVAAAYALGSIGAKNADAELRRALAKDSPFLQMTAAWALAKLHPDDEAAQKLAVEKLVHGMKSNDAAMRSAAARSLQMLHEPPELIAPYLVEVVNDPDPDVQTNVVNAVAGLGESVVPRVIIGLKNPQLRRPAVRVLTKLGPKASAAVKPLIDAAANADPVFRTQIQFALAAIGPAAAPATDLLVKSLASKEANERESALYALRKIGPGAKSAVKPLIQRAQSGESFDSLAAAWALARIAPDDPAVAAKVLPVLTRGLSSSNEETQLDSIEALADLGPAAAPAVAALEKAARDDNDGSVRSAAEGALKRVTGKR
jgi:HEAT repeat protein